MKLLLNDLVVFSRKVEVPDNCPHCDDELEDVGLYHWEFQDQKRSVNVIKIEGGLEDGKLGIEWDDCLPKGERQTWLCPGTAEAAGQLSPKPTTHLLVPSSERL